MVMTFKVLKFLKDILKNVWIIRFLRFTLKYFKKVKKREEGRKVQRKGG